MLPRPRRALHPLRGCPVIACKQPKSSYDTETGTHVCLVPGCGWTFRSVKSAEEPRWHRQEHRGAVPKTLILGNDWDGWRGQCGYSGQAVGCGGQLVVRGPHVRSYADCRRYVELHLVHDHGLVVCP